VLKVRGVPIRIHFTFALLVLFLVWRSGTRFAPDSAVEDIILILLVLGCVILHELGHTWVALKHGTPVIDMTLYPFGGLTRFKGHPERWIAEAMIAAGGPAVNLVIAALSWGLLHLSGASSGLTYQLLVLLLWSNLIIAGFNLIPAFPLDGGRILRSALTSLLGWNRATVWAASIGQMLALLLIGLGTVYEPWLILAGALILPGANAELRRALTRRSIVASDAGDVMITHWRAVAEETALSSLAGRPLASPSASLVTSDSGKVVGFIPTSRARMLRKKQAGSELTARDVMIPAASEISSTTPVLEALAHLDSEAAEAAPVIARDGELVGVVTRSALERARTLIEHLTQPPDSC
jgi:Zn-dependent protease/CBS domain-containing protein